MSKTKTNHDQEWLKVDARILGQLLAAQNILFVLPDETRIAEYYSQALSKVPGVANCYVCFENLKDPTGTHNEVCDECVKLRHKKSGTLDAPNSFSCKLSEEDNIRIITIGTSERTFGFFVFRIFSSDTFDLYSPFLNNLANYVALSLENRLQKNLLKKAHTELEVKVQERTEELQQMNERFSLATNSANLGVWDWDIQKDKLVWDDRMYALYGIKKDDFPGAYEVWLNKVHPDDRASCDEISRLAQLGEMEYDTEFRVVWPDGSIHNLEAHGQVVRDAQGKPLRMIGVNFDITERKQAEAAIFEKQQLFRTLVENSPDIIARYDHDCQRTYVNPVYLKVAQIPLPELLSTTPLKRSPLPATSAVILQNLLRRVLDSGVAEAVDVIWPKEDNIDYWYNVYAFPEFDREGKVISVMTISRDITKRKQAEKLAFKLNRIYAVLSNINQVIVRIHETKVLFNEACRIAVEFGKFRMAWIGTVNLQTNKIDVVALNGVVGDYLEKINIDLNDELQSNGPAGIAIKTGKYKISNNIRQDDTMIPWRDDAIKYDYKSVVSFPLIVFDKVVGVFLIYSNEVDFFDEGDISLLDEMAKDISFAMEFIESETERKQAEESQEKERKRMEVLLSALNTGLSLINPDMSIAWVNQKIREMFPGREPVGQICHVFYESRETICDGCGTLQAFVNGKVIESEQLVPSTGRWYYIISQPIKDAAGRVVNVLEGITDITERKQAEETLKEQYSKLQGIIESTDALIFSLDNQYRYTSFNHGHASMMKLIYNVDIMIGQNMLDYMTVIEDREKAKHNLDRALKGEQIVEEAYSGEEQRSRLYFQVSHNPIKTENGNIIGVVVLAQDISERRQIEETLRKNENALKEAQRVGRFGNWEWDIATDTITWSKEYYHIFGFDPTQPPPGYDEHLKVYTPESAARLDAAVKRNIDTGEPYELDLEISGREKPCRWITARSETKRNEKGQIVGLRGTAQDITERKLAEEAIQHSEYVTSIMNQISNAFLTHSDDEIYNQVLDIILKIFNCKIGLFGYIDQNFDLVIPSLTRNIWDKCQVEDKIIKSPHETWGNTLLGKAIREKKTYNSSGTFHIPLGHIPINNFLTVPIVYCNDTIGLLSLANRDNVFSEKDCDLLENIASYMSPILKARLQRDEQLIKRKVAEEEVLKLSKGIEQSPVSIIITDINGSIEYVNPKFCELTGYTKSEVIGKNMRILKSGYSTIADYKVLWETIKSGQVWIGEFYNKKKNGEYYWESASIAPIFNPNNEIIHFISIKEDITEKKKLLNDLVAAKEKAEESNRLKTEFLHNMSHEIRTPMNGIMGYSELLNEPNLSLEKQKQFTKIISSSSAQLLRIMDDILEISILDANQIKAINKKVCLNDLLLELFSIFDIKAKENKIPLYFKKGLPDSKSIIFTDETKLHKILNNILENALKFTLTGFVEMGYQLHDDEIEIYVKDTGIGINPKMQETIFERFSQEDKENTRLYGGLGLGLTIAKANAELLGGSITLKSEKGKGSTFYVTIPYKPAFFDKEITEPDINSTKITELTEITVLVVEDEEINYLYIETLIGINAPNIKVLHAINGQEAVELCKNNLQINLVLMDIKMPVMNGYEATKQIKEFRSDLPIVAQTAYSTSEDRNIAISAGCDDFVSKPINANTINLMLSHYLAKK